MSIIDIELKPHNKVRDFFVKLHSRMEDVLFSIVLKPPEKCIPSSLMSWLDRYTTKRMNELQQQVIKQSWKKVELEEMVDKIHIQ